MFYKKICLLVIFLYVAFVCSQHLSQGSGEITSMNYNFLNALIVINQNAKGLVPMKILVVDDMSSMRAVMLHMLVSLGHHQNDEAENGIQALKMLHGQDYDLLITDLHMPNLDGQQLLEKIRHDKKLHNLPVLMVSCEDDKERILSLISGKVTGFMMKPFNLNTLKKQLHWILDENRSLVS